MGTLDISADIEIAAAPADVAGVMFDPAREPEWIKIVTGVELIDPALAPGARVRRRGNVFGHEIAWTTEVERVQFPHLLTLRITDGPIAGNIRYDIQRSGSGSVVRIRGVAESDALGAVPVAFVKGPAQAALSADLARLKAIVEQP